MIFIFIWSFDHLFLGTNKEDSSMLRKKLLSVMLSYFLEIFDQFPFLWIRLLVPFKHSVMPNE